VKKNLHKHRGLPRVQWGYPIKVSTGLREIIRIEAIDRLGRREGEGEREGKSREEREPQYDQVIRPR
jgi:hypothetical protein